MNSTVMARWIRAVSSIGMTNFREKTWSDPVPGASQMTSVDNSIWTLYMTQSGVLGWRRSFRERLRVRA